MLGHEVTVHVNPVRLRGVELPAGLLRRLSPAEVVLFHLCDALPRDALFSRPEELAASLGLEGAKRLFSFDDWQHVTTEPPSSSPNLVAMVDALCDGEAPPPLTGRPNGDYRLYLRALLEQRPEDDELWGPPAPPGATSKPAKATPAPKRAKRAR